MEKVCAGWLERVIGCEKGERDFGEVPFGRAVAPWVAVALEELERRADVGVLGGVMGELEEELARRLSELCVTAFVLEMHIVKMQGELVGETGKARYGDYVRRYLFDAGYLREFFLEYRVLGQWVEGAMELWVKKVAELARRLEGDLEGLEERFGVEGAVVDVGLGLSDPHNGNQSVYRFQFENGRTVFYKPKSLAVDVVFGEFLNEVGSWGLDLKGYVAWDRGDYGWCEEVEYLPCKSEGEVSAYYRHSGMLLGLFYLFGATDMHCENVIANGPCPVAIDLESLFHPNLNSKAMLDNPKEWNRSVLRVGMLPNFIMGETGLPGIDISAFASANEHEAPSFVPKWEGVNTDEMRLHYVRGKMGGKMNVVRLGEEEVDPRDYVKEITQGFAALNLAAMERRAALAGPGGWLDRFASCPVRCICRPTRLYFKLLQQLVDPGRLRDETRHAEILDILPRYMLENGNEHLEPVVQEELRAMDRRDIPFFQTLPSSCHLYLNGKVIIENVLEEPSLEAARALILEMDEEKCAEQIALIEHAFYVVGSDNGQREMRDVPRASTPLSREELLEEAEKIGHELLKRGRRDGNGGLRWLGIEFMPAEEQAQLATLSRNFYGGFLGVSAFLAALYKASGKALWKQSAEVAAKPFCRALDGDGVERMSGAFGLGGMTGVGSYIYSLGLIGDLLGESKYFMKALFLLSHVHKRHIHDDTVYDVIGGSAGFILSLLSLHAKTGADVCLDKAHLAARHLIASAHEEEGRLSWLHQGRRGLCGFSHGVAGIAYALEWLGEKTQTPEYIKEAAKGVAYEKHHYCPEANNWPDFRSKKPSLIAFSWCHGAPGIVLGRACGPQSLLDETRLAEIQNGLRAMREQGKRESDHLCCGELGLAEIYDEVGRRLGDEELRAWAQLALATCVQRARLNGTFRMNGMVGENVFCPGFMQGLSGIGYTLVRHACDGEGIPNPLILQ